MRNQRISMNLHEIPKVLLSSQQTYYILHLYMLECDYP